MRLRISATLFVALLVSLAGLFCFAAAGSTIVRVKVELGSDAKTRSPKVRRDAGLIRYGSGNWSGLRNANRYGVIVASAANANSAGDQPGRALMYACGIDMPADRTSTLCGVSFAYAASKDWILRDEKGSYVHAKGQYPVLVDIGNRAYQRRFVRAIDADLRTHPGVDGVIIDDVTGSLISISSKYRDNASYRSAMLAFIKAVGPPLKAKGWYVAVNASILDADAQQFTGQSYDGTQYIWWVKQIGPYVSGISTERWQQNWDRTDSVRASGTAANQAWDAWERLPSVVASVGKDFYAIEKGALDDTGKAAYLRASFLLAWKRGRGAFFYTDDYAGRGDPWRLVATPNIGRPVGPRRRIGVGFGRSFTNGTVVVNPSPSESQTFGFQRKYLLPDGTTTTSVTLPPTSGLVLSQASVARHAHTVGARRADSCGATDSEVGGFRADTLLRPLPGARVVRPPEPSALGVRQARAFSTARPTTRSSVLT
jgi:Hypothetical glycosyl hydrolase family 15